MLVYSMEEIKALRQYLGLSVENFYQFLDLTKQTGYNLEKGRVNASKVVRLAATSVLNYIYDKEEIDIEEILNEYRAFMNNEFYQKIKQIKEKI